VAVSLLQKGDEWILSLSGIVDVSEAGALHALAREAAHGAPHAVVVRLDGLQALDTATTQVLLALQRSGRVLRFESIPPQVADLWRHAGLGDHLG